VAVLLVVIGCLLAPIALAGTWARREVVDVDRFVALTTPLARDPEVREAVSDRLTTEVERQIDRFVPGVVPDSLIERASRQVVDSQRFETVWDQLMRLAHPQLLNVAFGEGDEDLVGGRDGRITIDLRAAAVLALQQVLGGNDDRLPAALTRASGDDWKVVVFQSEDLVRIQGASRLGNDIVVPLAVAAGVALLLALVIAPDRDKTLKWIGIGGLIGAVALGLGLAFGRIRYVAVLDSQVSEGVAKRTFDILAASLVDRVRVFFVVALVLTTIGVLLSPWRAARAGERRERGSIVSWLQGHRGDLAWTVLAAGLGVLVWWERPTGLVTTLVVAGAVAAALLVALLGRGARPAAAA